MVAIKRNSLKIDKGVFLISDRNVSTGSSANYGPPCFHMAHGLRMFFFIFKCLEIKEYFVTCENYMKFKFQHPYKNSICLISRQKIVFNCILKFSHKILYKLFSHYIDTCMASSIFPIVLQSLKYLLFSPLQRNLSIGASVQEL